LRKSSRWPGQLVARGVTRIRLTGGEPLSRRGATEVARGIGALLGHGLDELTLTTNGTFLADHADALWDAGIRRINVSLDSRDPERFRHVTRQGDLARVLGWHCGGQGARICDQDQHGGD
jgi:cyclic pyranopterin phosphate synthase